MTGSPAERRARRLLRWYPRSWRNRYGAEFAELLLAELADTPRDWRRTADVIVNGLLARCTAAGLTRHELPAPEQLRSGLATLAITLGAVLTLGVAMLAQLATGWQWASPASAQVTVGAVVMAAALAGLLVIAVAAVVPVAWHTALAVLRREPGVVGPALLATFCFVVLVSGARHFANAWPGTGGTGAHHGLIPGGLAAFGWASTLSVSSYWAHPALLSRFPPAEVGWMALSPVLAAGLTACLVVTWRRLRLPAGTLRYLASLAAAASWAGAAFLAGASSWVLARSSAEPGLFRPGLVDGVGLLVMVLAFILTLRAVAGLRRARAALGPPAAR